MKIEQIKASVTEINDWVISIRRDFHMYPELGGEEFRTSAKIQQYLTEMGITWKLSAYNTGVVGIIEGKQPGKVVALRADIDALPMEDRKDCDYKSVNNGKMHACGHDAHTAVLLGVAKILSENRQAFSGSVKLFFQPAEENIGGAKKMIELGCMEDPKVDYVLGWHTENLHPFEAIGLRAGKTCAAIDDVRIFVHGKQSHGAYPHTGVDAILMASQIVVALQSVVSRCVDPLDSVVLAIGMMNGGTADNIICDEMVLIGTLRTLTKEKRGEIVGRITAICEGICAGFGGSCTVNITPDYPALFNDPAIIATIAKNSEMLGFTNYFVEQPEMGGEDFSYFADSVPSGFFTIGTWNPKNGEPRNAHEDDFDIDDSVLRLGVELQVLNVLTLLAVK